MRTFTIFIKEVVHDSLLLGLTSAVMVGLGYLFTYHSPIMVPLFFFGLLVAYLVETYGDIIESQEGKK